MNWPNICIKVFHLSLIAYTYLVKCLMVNWSGIRQQLTITRLTSALIESYISFIHLFIHFSLHQKDSTQYITRLYSESPNLHQGQNLNRKWSGIRIRIFGFIRIRIQMSAVSLPKYSGFIPSSIVKIGWWLYQKC